MLMYLIAGCVCVAGFLAVLLPILFRVVVKTSECHIVQSNKKTVSYGVGKESGNAYYAWPSFVPLIGVTRTILPVNNFDLHLKGYKAYDKERVPFELDVIAFFRIEDTNKAAERISNFDDLKKQLDYIAQGAARKILASHDIHEIMVDRSTFGQQFTNEVQQELLSWGVIPVKNMELMDIRDSEDSKVIANIMAKKSSNIAMESRMEVAKNNQTAETAEIEARRAVELAKQEAEQQIGEREASKDKAVGIAQQKSDQEIKTEQAITAEKEMTLLRVKQVQQSEIDKQSAMINGERDKQVAILKAEADLEKTKRLAEGVTLEGQAKASAEEAMQLAPVKAQIVLAKEIGTNENYQQYLVSLKSIEAQITVGTAQAEALKGADVKVIANTGNAIQGVSNAMELFTSQGGTSIGGMLESLANTEQGKHLLNALKLLLAKDSKQAKDTLVQPK